MDSDGNAFICGETGGNLGGRIGSDDAFLRKYNSSGNILWTKQIGSSQMDYCFSVAMDRSGNAYISGATYGNIFGTNAGSYDAYLAKYNSSGSLLWSKQIGTSSFDVSYSVAVDWNGNAYMSGSTDGSLGGPNAGSTDSFLVKYNSSGALLWSKQIGTSGFDSSRSVSVDREGNAYLSGTTYGSLAGPNAGSTDVFLTKFDSFGNLLWSGQIGTSSSDSSKSVAVDGSGNAYISGTTQGNLGGTNSGFGDAFLAKLDSSGNLLWTKQTSFMNGTDCGSVTVDAAGNAFISGNTNGSVERPATGGCDAFLIKYTAVPEPSTIIFLGTWAISLLANNTWLRRKFRYSIIE